MYCVHYLLFVFWLKVIVVDLALLLNVPVQ